MPNYQYTGQDVTKSIRQPTKSRVQKMAWLIEGLAARIDLTGETKQSEGPPS